MARFYPFTPGDNIYRGEHTYVALLLRGYEQVVGQGVAGIRRLMTSSLSARAIIAELFRGGL